jgi:beta-lactamase superfamily II metal-dependent hydrolase
MTDFYEIDFLQVHSKRSGDAIAIRYQIGGQWAVHVVDGGFSTTSPVMEAHIRFRYGTELINEVVVTHGDQDHAEGLLSILENMRVARLWMLRPWLYTGILLPYFARYNSADRLAARLREDYPYLAALEEVAIRKGIPIAEPFQGEKIGPFTILAPSPQRYLQMVIASDKTPQQIAGVGGLLGGLYELARPIVRKIKAGWGSEKFSAEETSTENEMSVVQFARLNGHSIVLTGDAGRAAMTEAANFAPQAGLFLPGVTCFQAPHHGGRRNVSSAVLDRWLGPVLPQMRSAGHELFTAMISSAKEDEDHPRNAVLRGLLHRGAKILTTEDQAFWVYGGAAPARHDYYPMANVNYPDEQEED